MGRSTTNFLLYNIGWFACVFFAAEGQSWVGVTTVILVAFAHLLSAPRWFPEAMVLAAVGLLGFFWESLLVWTSVLSYPTAPGLAGFAPVWIVALWINFATTLNVSLAWIRSRWWVAALFGAVGGPLAFVAGEKLGAVSFPDTGTSLAVLAGGWAVLLPLCCRLADRFERLPEPAENASGSGRSSLLGQVQMMITGKGLDE